MCGYVYIHMYVCLCVCERETERENGVYLCMGREKDKATVEKC
jgi:hypothetical protein